MAIKQTIWSLEDKKELSSAMLLSENELENLIDENIHLLNENWMIIGRQVYTRYGGIIDLLCIDSGGNPVVVELKKGMTPREVTAQALDYASWIKELDSDELAEIYLKYSKGTKSLGDAFQDRFGVKLDDDNDDSETQIVIVATDMDGSTERIIQFLQGFGIDINVLFFNVFEHMGKRLLSRAWMFEPDQISQPAATISRPWNGEYYFSYGADEQRSWKDAVEYGFVSAGGGSWYTGTMRNLEPGSRIWVNIPHEGYVGVGRVLEAAQPARNTYFTIDGQIHPFYDLPREGVYYENAAEEQQEHLVKVEWEKTAPRAQAVSEYGFFGNQNTVCRPRVDKWDFTIKRLKEKWNLED